MNVMLHSEEYYHPNGKCTKCGSIAGLLTPLKIVDEIYGIACVQTDVLKGKSNA